MYATKSPWHWELWEAIAYDAGFDPRSFGDGEQAVALLQEAFQHNLHRDKHPNAFALMLQNLSLADKALEEGDWDWHSVPKGEYTGFRSCVDIWELQEVLDLKKVPSVPDCEDDLANREALAEGELWSAWKTVQGLIFSGKFKNRWLERAILLIARFFANFDADDKRTWIARKIVLRDIEEIPECRSSRGFKLLSRMVFDERMPTRWSVKKPEDD